MRAVLVTASTPTGDIVSIDADGFVKIIGRAKRFSKIAGEMVSLAAVDELLSTYWPNKRHAVIAIADERKGEQLIVVTEQPDLNRKILFEKFKEHGVSELSVPRTVHSIKKLPLLGSGKPDFIAIDKIITALS